MRGLKSLSVILSRYSGVLWKCWSQSIKTKQTTITKQQQQQQQQTVKTILNSANTWTASFSCIDVCYVGVGLHVVARAYMLSVQGTLIKRAM